MRKPDDRLLAMRRQLAARITQSLGANGQHVISRSYGIPQPRMSELSRGIVDRCSLEWLIRRVHRLGGTVTLTVEVGDAARTWTRGRMSGMRERHRPENNGR